LHAARIYIYSLVRHISVTEMFCLGIVLIRFRLSKLFLANASQQPTLLYCTKELVGDSFIISTSCVCVWPGTCLGY